MTESQYRRAMRILDHAIDSLGETKPCFLLVQDGNTLSVPSTHSNSDAARAILVRAMLSVVKAR